jgi:hypothetical protein
MYGHGLLTLSSKLWVSMGQQNQLVESSGAHKAVEVLESSCVGTWTFRTHGSCCRDKGSKSSGSQSPGACLPGAGFQEPQELLQSWENKACGQR